MAGFDFAGVFSLIKEKILTVKITYRLNCMAPLTWLCANGKFVHVHTMKAYMVSGGTAPLIINLYAKWMWGQRHALAPKLPGKNPRRLRLKCDGTCAETRFRLLAKRMSPFISAGASVQSTTGRRAVRISGSNAGYTIFLGIVKGEGSCE